MARDYFAEDFPDLAGGSAAPPGRDYFAEDFPEMSASVKPDFQMPNSFLPNQAQVETKIAGRENPWDMMSKPGISGFGPLPVMAAPFQAAESAIAAPALDVQAGNTNPVKLISSTVKGALGTRPAQLGDVIRTTGVGGSANEALATAVGMGASAPIAAGVGKAAGAAGKGVARFGENVSRMRNPAKFAQEVRGDMFGLRTNLGRELGDAVTALSDANPDKVVDAADHFHTIKDALKTPAEGGEAISGLRSEITSALKQIKDPKLNQLVHRLIQDPEQARNLTLRQAEDIKKAIERAPSIVRKRAQGRFANWTQGDHELLDLIDNIKASIAEEFPQLAEMRRPYAEYMNAYNKVKGRFKEGSLIGKLKKGFGDEEITKLVQKVLPPETFEDVQSFRRTGKGLVYTGGAALGLLGLKGGEMLFDQLKDVFSRD